MKRLIAVIVALLVIAAAALVYFSLSKPAPSAASLLPESTLALIDIPDFPKSRAEFAKTEFYKLWREPEVQAFLARPLTSLQTASMDAGAPKDTDTLAGILLGLMQGEAFVAVTHVTVFPSFNPGLVVGMDVRHRRVEAIVGLYELESKLKQSHPNAAFQDKEYLGVKYTIWETEPGFEICHSFFNSLVVFTLGEDSMRDLIASFTGQVPRDFKRLADSPKFRNVQQHAAKNHDLLAYFNVEGALNLVGPLLALSPQTASAYDKFSRVQATAYSMTFVDRGIEDVGFVSYSSALPKLTPPTQRKTLALTMPDTLVYSVGSFDLAAAYEEGMQTLSQSGSANLMLTVGQFQQALRDHGIRMPEDVLQKVGPEFAVVANWRPGARIPGVAIVSEVTDADKLRPALDAALNALKNSAVGSDDQFPWNETQSDSQPLRSVRAGPRLPTVAYAVTDRFFILASSPDYARDLLTQLKESKPTLATSPVYQESMKRLPTNGSSYTYVDLHALFGPLYNLAKSGLSLIGTNEFVDLVKLPQSETIAKHLFPYVSATVCEPQQTTSMSFSPLGKSLAAAAGIGGAFWAVNTYGPQFLPQSTPARPKRSSSRVAPSAPPENQTAGSPTQSTP